MCSQSIDDGNRNRDEVGAIRIYSIDLSPFIGLTTHPGHALVDTGAQSGVVGLNSWQIWVAGLALHEL